jgi:phenylacetate-CoA ligase
MSNAIVLRSFSLVGWDRSYKSYWFWNVIYLHEKIRRNPFLKFVLRLINRTIIVDAVNTTTKDYDRFTRQIRRYKPRVLFGNARIITNFARYVAKRGVQLRSVKLVVTTVEKLEDRPFLEKTFRSPVYDYYSSTECYAIAIETNKDEKGLMRAADDGYVLNFYENGEIIVTALHSLGFPLINYQIGDYGAGSEEIARREDSLPFSTMKIKIGRTTDLFMTKDGRAVNTNALIMDLARFRLNTKEQQFIQTGFDTIIARYVPDQDFNENYEQMVYGEFEKYFGEDLKIEFHQVDEIPLEKSGKKLYCKRIFSPEMPRIDDQAVGPK